jgi:hypothetical protein
VPIDQLIQLFSTSKDFCKFAIKINHIQLIIMDLFLIITAGILLLIGFLGSVLPVLPGIPLSYGGILLLHFTEKYQFETNFLILWAIIVIIIQVLDYYIPIWGTKKFGGSKSGVRGSIIGLLVGMFFGPFGIIFGPFAGALIGELIAQKPTHEALKAAFGAFLGFIVGTVSKLVVAGMLIYYYIITII